LEVREKVRVLLFAGIAGPDPKQAVQVGGVIAELCAIPRAVTAQVLA